MLFQDRLTRQPIAAYLIIARASGSQYEGAEQHQGHSEQHIGQGSPEHQPIEAPDGRGQQRVHEAVAQARP